MFRRPRQAPARTPDASQRRNKRLLSEDEIIRRQAVHVHPDKRDGIALLVVDDRIATVLTEVVSLEVIEAGD